MGRARSRRRTDDKPQRNTDWTGKHNDAIDAFAYCCKVEINTNHQQFAAFDKRRESGASQQKQWIGLFDWDDLGEKQNGFLALEIRRNHQQERGQLIGPYFLFIFIILALIATVTLFSEETYLNQIINIIALLIDKNK